MTRISGIAAAAKSPAFRKSYVSQSLTGMAALLLAVGGVFTARDLQRTEPQPLAAAIDAPQRPAGDAPRYLSKDIRDLQVMQDRVLADNPLDDETEIPLGEIDPAEWRVVVLEHVEADGTRHVIERGVPLEEIEGDSHVAVSLRRDESPGVDPYTEYVDENGYVIDASDVAKILAAQQSTNDEATEPLTVGSTLFVDLPEHGVSADFTITAILPSPTPNPGDGCLVTTKFIHENAEILDLRIEGSAEVIGTTASHPK